MRLNVVFEVPPEIARGMATGEYRVTGGVVRNVRDGQKIVRHIKEAHPGRLMDPSRLPSALSTVAQVASIANLGVSVAGFALALRKLGQIEAQLQALSESVARLQSKVDHIARLATTIEKLGWARLVGRVESALETSQRSTLIANGQLATHLAADALSKLSGTEKELLRLSADEELDLPLRSVCAQMAVFVGTAAAALYGRLGEHDAALQVLEGLRESTATLKQNTRALYLCVPLALRYHPQLRRQDTTDVLLDLFDWSEADLDSALARSVEEDLGHQVSAGRVRELLSDHEAFARVLTVGAVRGGVRFGQQRPLALLSSFSAARTVRLARLTESYAEQASLSRRIGGGAILWDDVDQPAPPADAELAYLSVDGASSG